MSVMSSAVRARDLRVALITGVAGVGKTRLAQEVVLRARQTGARVGTGRAWADAAAPPLWPWYSILRDLGASAHLQEPGLGPTTRDRYARFTGVLEHLRTTAQIAAPVVIVIDDVDRADEATLLLISFVMREQRGLPLVMLLTRRDEGAGRNDASPMLSEIERDATTILLRGLPRSAIRRYLVALGVRSVSSDLLDAAAALTGGNPLLLRQAATRGVLEDDFAGALEHSTDDIVARLPTATQQLVAVAALLGPLSTLMEIAAVSGASLADVDRAICEARSLGLLERTASSTVAFVHDLVRQAIVSSTPLDERLNVHARAAAELRGSGPAHMLKRSHHALEAAIRSTEDVERAIGLAREAARQLHQSGGFEAAAGLLRRAFEVHVSSGSHLSAAILAVEHAEAVLACGRLAEARPLFDRAAKLAESEGDTSSLARAALGLGGFWLREHRLADDTARVTTLQRRALAKLPPDADVLRARLQARLATEDVYRGAPIERAVEALHAVRRTGDAHALAEALSLYHHLLTGPEYTAQRLAIAEEIIASAVAADDPLLTLVGLCWRAADLLLAGDTRGPVAVEELRMRAEALQCRSILFAVRAMQVMLEIRSGRLADAEAAAQGCYAFGMEVGDVDALAYYGGQLSAIRVFQGREAELSEMAASIAESPTLIHERERSFVFAAALCALRGGNPARAQTALEQFMTESDGGLSRSSSWLTSMLAVVELAAAMNHAAAARRAYDALLPFADRPVMGSLLAVVCFGSTYRLLGVAASTCGEYDRAVEHQAAAIAANERLGHRPAAIQARAELGLACLARGRGNDHESGTALVREASSLADTLGMNALATRWREALTRFRPRDGPHDMATLSRAAEPGLWRVSYAGQVATVRDRIGLHYLEQLTGAPGRSIPALTLAVKGHTSVHSGQSQRVVDETALRALRDRMLDLRRRDALSAEEQNELDALDSELRRVLGLGGRIRNFADAAERARTSVTKAIRRALEEISSANPAVGEHLSRHVSTGTYCRYWISP